jgi:hypothetical protein
VIDATNGVMYFVSKVIDSSNPGQGGQSYIFHAIDLGNKGVDLNAVVNGVPNTPTVTALSNGGVADIFGTKLSCTGGPGVGPQDPKSCYDPNDGLNNPHFNAASQLQRPGLLLAGSNVLVGFGSNADTFPWQGYLFSFSTSHCSSSSGCSIAAVRPLISYPPAPIAGKTFDPNTHFQQFPTGGTTYLSGNSLWAGGGGLAYDGVSKVYFATANNTANEDFSSNFDNVLLPQTTPDYSNSIFQVDPVSFWSCLPIYNGANSTPAPTCLPMANNPGGQSVSYWQPSGYHWNYGDYDLGSSRVILADGVPITAGKANILVSVPSVNGTDVEAIKLFVGGDLPDGVQCFNNLTYWNGTVYAWCSGSPLGADSLTDLSKNSLSWSSSAEPNEDDNGYLPVALCSTVKPAPGSTEKAILQCADAPTGGSSNNVLAPALTAFLGANISISSRPTSDNLAVCTANNPHCGILWATYVGTACKPNGAGHYGYFTAYDAVSLTRLNRFFLGTELGSPTECSPSDTGSQFVKFTPPVVYNGRVYVSTAGDFHGDGAVLVYGITPTPAAMVKK